MPREYIRREKGRMYVNYTGETLKKCLYAVECGMPKITASRIYNIPLRTLTNKINGLHSKKAGGQMLFTEEEEHHFVNHILKITEIGYPITFVDIRNSVAVYLNNKGEVIEKFTDNVPGQEWARLLIKRHHYILSKIPALNVKGKRAKIAREEVEQCIDKIRESVDEFSSHVSSESAQLAANIGKAFLQHFERKLGDTCYSVPTKKLNLTSGENVHLADFEDSIDIELDSEIMDLPPVTSSSTTALAPPSASLSSTSRLLSPSADGPQNVGSLSQTHCSPIGGDSSPTDIIIEIDEDVEACISSTTGIVSETLKCAEFVVVKDNGNLLNSKTESQKYSSVDNTELKDSENLLRDDKNLLPKQESQNYVAVKDVDNLPPETESQDYILVVRDENLHPETVSQDCVVVKDDEYILPDLDSQDYCSENYVIVKDELLDVLESQDYVIVEDVETLLPEQASQETSRDDVIVEDNGNILHRPKSQDYSTGDYVVVKDNDNLFPGKVLIVLDDGLIVSCMKRGRKSWKWPLEEVNMLCQFHNILYKKLVIKEKEGEIFLLSRDGYHVIL